LPSYIGLIHLPSMTDQFRKPSASSSVLAGTTAPAADQPQPSKRWLLWLLVVGVALVLVYAAVVRPMMRSAGSARVRPGFGAVPVSAEPARRLISVSGSSPSAPLRRSTRSRFTAGWMANCRRSFYGGHDRGGRVPPGDLDPRPFEVQKLQSEALLAKDNALLDEARLDLVRYQTLLAQDSVASSRWTPRRRWCGSTRRRSSWTRPRSQARRCSSRILISFPPSPAGSVCATWIKATSSMPPTPNGIAVITQLHPITVLFAIPQDAVPKVMTRFKTGEPMTVEAYDRGDGCC